MFRLEKAVIFYFSGTGNTWWAAQTLAAELQAKGIETSSRSIEQLARGEAGRLIAENDAAGIAYPIYGSDLPELMKDFIGSLPPERGKKAFVFCTQWMWSGDGARVGAQLLQDKGFQVNWAEHFSMPNNISVTVTSFLPYTNDPAKLARKLAKTAVGIRRFAGQVAGGRPFLRGFNLAARLAGDLQRIPFRRVFPRLRDDIGTDLSRCNGCGICAHLCPADNLILEASGIKPLGGCILCMRCYSFCPQMAITYMKKPHRLSRGKPYRGPVEQFDPHLLKQP